MSDPQTIGDLIRERRLALGFSAGQLAMRLHSTAAVVRTWERGHEAVPDDAFPGLAELLGVPEADMRALQPASRAAEPPTTQEPTSKLPVSDAPVSERIGEEDSTSDSNSATVETPARPPVAPEAAAGSSHAAATNHPESTSPDLAGNGAKEAPPVVGHTPGLELDTGMLEAPTEAIEPVRPAPAPAATRLGRSATAAAAAPVQTADPAPVTPRVVEPEAIEVDGSVPDWLGPLKLVFDPSKRYLYWARALGVVIGLYVVFRILGFALDELVDAIGDFWDSFSTPEPAGDGLTDPGAST